MLSKTNIIMAVAAICLGGAAYSLNANADPYIGTSVFTLDTDVGDFRGVDLNAGYRFGELLELRGSYMLGAQDETYQGVNIELDRKYGVDLIVNLPLSETIVPFVSVGNMWLKAKLNGGGYSASASDDFTTYGFGVRLDIREAFSVVGEYKYVDGDTIFALGMTANF